MAESSTVVKLYPSHVHHRDGHERVLMVIAVQHRQQCLRSRTSQNYKSYYTLLRASGSVCWSASLPLHGSLRKCWLAVWEKTSGSVRLFLDVPFDPLPPEDALFVSLPRSLWSG